MNDDWKAHLKMLAWDGADFFVAPLLFIGGFIGVIWILFLLTYTPPDIKGSCNSFEEEFGNIMAQSEFDTVVIDVTDAPDHIRNGLSALRFRHAENGNTNHVFRLDYVGLVDGFTTTVTHDHDAFAGRGKESNHPWAASYAALDNATLIRDHNKSWANNTIISSFPVLDYSTLDDWSIANNDTDNWLALYGTNGWDLENASGVFTCGNGCAIDGSQVITVAGGTALSQDGSGLSVTNDAIGDTQLAFDTGQALTIASLPKFAGMNLTGDLKVTGMLNVTQNISVGQGLIAFNGSHMIFS